MYVLPNIFNSHYGNFMEVKEWGELMAIAGDAQFVIERISFTGSGIAIEGPFDLPGLARLPDEEQAFVTAFIRCHGSIKQMESYFGVSYPTIKNRLNKISDRLEFVDIAPGSTKTEILDKLEKGEITADEAVEVLKKGN